MIVSIFGLNQRIRRSSATPTRTLERVLRILLSSLTLASCVTFSLSPTIATARTSGTLSAHPFAPHVAQAAQRFEIPEHWIWAVMRQESGGKVRARSHAGAMGLMQIMPATWSMLSQQYKLGSNPYEIAANIHAGAAYLRLMWDRYRDVPLMLAAYNAGPRRADDYVHGKRPLPKETRDYVAAIAPSLAHSGSIKTATMSRPTDSMASQSPAASWREASLIAVQGSGNRSGRESSSQVQSERAPLETQQRVLTPANPESRTLFVPLSATSQ